MMVAQQNVPGANSRNTEPVPPARNLDETNVVSVLVRAGYGHGSRWNGHQAAPSLLPRRARDADNIALKPTSVNHFPVTESEAWWEIANWDPVGRLQIIRYVVVLVTGFIAGSRCVDAARSWHEWRLLVATDPSAADAYRSVFVINALAAAISLVIAALVWWLLRPHPSRAELR
jgi:hypothetical protein